MTDKNERPVNENEDLNAAAPKSPENIDNKPKKKRPALKVESVEPRILLSTTWIHGTDGADFIEGTDGSDVIDGLDGDDILSGGLGDDDLMGELGNDILDGGLGDDLLDGGFGTDIADFSGADADMNIDLSAGTATGDGTDTLVDIEGALGSLHDDTFAFTAAENGDTFTIDGADGSDTLDLSDYSVNDATFTDNTIDISLDDGGSFSVTHENIEQIDFSDASMDVHYGTDGADAINPGGNDGDFIVGGDGDDNITTSRGDDVVVTGSGDNTVSTDRGDDLIISSTGDNTIDSGAHNDTIEYFGGNDDVNMGLGNDSFVVNDAQDGQVVTLDGANGTDTIDLSAYSADSVHDNGSSISVDLEDGGSFTINYTNIENIITGEAEVAENTAPEALNDSFDTAEDTPFTTTSVFANDTDLDGDTISVDSFTQADNGSVTYNDDGTFTYTPDDNFNGTDTFTYTITDESGATDTATVTVNVSAVNDGPETAADSVTTNEDAAVTTGNVLANDTDLDGDTLSVDSFTQADNGTVSYNGDGTFSYTPDANFNGTDTFTYTIADGNGGTATETVTVEVSAVNDGPEAAADTFTTDEDAAVTTGNVLANDTDLDGDTISMESFTQADNGTVTYNDDGTFTYTPDANFNGTDTFTYTITDESGATDTATVTVNVSAVNDGPETAADSVTTDEDAAVTTENVLANDTDLDGDALSVDSFTQADNGTVTYNDDGTFTYTPDANFNGTDTFTYTITDGNGGTATETVTVTVNAVNDGPEAAADSFTTDEDTAITTGNVLDNDTDLDGDSISVESFTQADNGTVTYNDDGTFTYTPDANVNGTDTFTYTITDESGATDTATVTVNVNAVNDGPEATADSVTTDEDAAVTTGNVLANDTDLDGDTLSVDSFTQADNGTVSYNGDGTFTYTPDANFNGTDTFTYTITDGNGGKATETVTVTVNSINDGPEAAADSFTTDEDTTLTTGNVLTNDTDIDGDALSVDTFTQAENGTVSYNGDGTFTYTPDANFNGTDKFTYTVMDGQGGTDTETVTITVNAVNDGPEAANNSASTFEDTEVTTVNVLANDTDIDGDTLSVESFTQGSHGTVSYNDDGTFTYMPDTDYNGTDTFTYTVTDSNGGTDTATVTIDVASINDNPDTVTDSYTTDEDTVTVTGNVLANDYDVDGDEIRIFTYSQPAHGNVSYNNDGTFTYTPDANYNGTDVFTYTVIDEYGASDTATVSFTVNAVNDNPDAVEDTAAGLEDTTTTTDNVLANDSDIDGDTLSMDSFTQAENGTVEYNGDGTFSYTPDANFNGEDTFTYTVSDGQGGTTTQTVTIEVEAVNDNPEATGESYTLDEDGTVTTDRVLTNDTDVDGDGLMIKSFTRPENGTIRYNSSGTFTYTPNENFNGTDSITYTVTDRDGLTSTATITFDVTAQNDGPEASGDQLVAVEDNSATTINVLDNDSDLDGDTVSVDSFTQAEHGTVSYNDDGTFTYTPDADYNGSDSFTYTITDGNGETDTATVRVNVTTVNDDMVANDDTAVTTEDTAVTTVRVVANDIDVDGDGKMVVDFSQADHGTVAYNSDGTFTYTPDANYNGTDTFTYTVTDGYGEEQTATVTVSVGAVNDAPDAVNDAASTDVNTTVTTGNIFANDSDVDGDDITLSNYTQPDNGTVTYNGDGTFTYTPDADYTGTDTFTYTIVDENGATDTATIRINVDDINHGPDAENDSLATDINTTITTENLLANDSDPDGDALTVDSFTQPAHGSIQYNGDGTFTYTPDADYNGIDTFTYTITDGNGGTDTATVSVTVGEVNTNPDARNDTVFTDEDTSVTTHNVLDNDTDADGDAITLTDYTQPAHGSVTYNNDGTFTYTPDADYSGTDTFTYTITDENGATDTATIRVGVGETNDQAFAEDDTLSTDEDTSAITVNVLDNDVDADGDGIMITNYSQGVHGRVNYNSDGTFTYTPDANYHGTDTFTYTVTDGNGVTDTATVTVNVASVNDDPVARDDEISTDEDTSITTENLLENDYDVDGDEFVVDNFTQPEHGTVSYNGDGSFTYTPDADYNGSDSFTYTITDPYGATNTATVNVNVAAVNDAPDAGDDVFELDEDTVITTTNVLGNDVDVDGDGIMMTGYTQTAHGQLQYHSDGTFTYTPELNYNGTDSFTYTITDNNGEETTATVTFNIAAVNDAPEAEDDSYSTAEDTAVTTESVLSNDVDVDGDIIEVESFTQPAHGTASYNGDGTFTYTPDADYNGTDTFTYTITDNNGETSTATITVNVTAVNDSNIAVDDTLTIDEDHSVTTQNVLANDIDVDGDGLLLTNYTQPEHGTIHYNNDGTFTYTPDLNYNGTDSFTYTAIDGHGGESTGTITININAVNDDPVAKNNWYSVNEDNTIHTGDVLRNDSDVDGDTLTIVDFDQPVHGTLQYNDDGTFTYTPDENFNGYERINYTVSDGNGGTDTARMTIRVKAVNDVPVAESDSVTTLEDNSVTTHNVLSNDSDVDGDTLSVSEFTQGAHGSVTYNNDGTFTYTPDADYNGTDSFTYTVSDGHGGTDTTTIDVEIDAVNDAPVANADSYTTDEDNSVTTANVMGNDYDIDSENFDITDYSQPSNGTVVYNDDGTFTYTPDANFNGTDTFTYTITDDQGASDTVEITINVNAVNDGPVANNDVFDTAEDNAVTTGNIIANDTDIDGDTLSVDSFTQGSHGTVTYNDDGTFTYTPDANYNGTDTFTYTIADGNGGTDTATVTVNVSAVNDGPDARYDRFYTDEDSPLVTGNVLANDRDVEGDELTLTSFSQPKHGSVSYNGDGTFTYTPDANYNGKDTFTYTISDGNGGTDTATIRIDVAAVNDDAVAVNDSFTTNEDSPLTGNLVSNDTDIDGDTLSVDSFTQPDHGELSVNADGTFTYTPDANYNGTDSFTYEVTDGNGNTDTATVTINVTAVNDGPEANADTFSVDEDSTVTTGNVLANDTDIEGDSLSVDSFTQGAHGTVTYNDDGTFNYTPDANFNGTDTFTYTVTDGNGGTDTATITVNVNAVNDDAVATDDTISTTEDTAITTGNLLANDTDIDGDALSVDSFTQGAHGTVSYNGDGSFTYTPDADYNGTDTFTYEVTDGQGNTDTATVTVNIGAVNDGPEAADDTFSVDEDSTVTTGNVLANDTDLEGDTLSVSSFSQGPHGTVSYNDDGTFNYTPDANFNGTDTFTYTVTDGNGGTDTATITINVNAVNDDAIAGNDTISTTEDSSVTTGNLLANDTDIDGDSLSVDSFTQGAHGTVTYNGDGSFTYTPDADYNGTDTFTYEVTDGNGNTDTATVTVNVSAANDSAVAGDDTVTVAEDSSVTTGNLLANDTDVDGDALSVDSFTQGAHGTVSYNGDGSFTYTPDANFNGTDTFTYEVTDGDGNTDTATVTVNVTAVNDGPVATGESTETVEDTAVITQNVLANDTDIDGDTLSVESFTQGAHGTVTYNDDGTFTYTPDANYNGTDSFTYTITDSNGGTSTATMEVNITAANDGPEANDDTVTTYENETVTTGNVLANDTDLDGDEISLESFTQPAHGTVTYNGDGTFTYTPDAKYDGTDSFTYTITDENGATDTATVDITIISVNDAPEAADDVVTTAEDTATTVNVLANDTDIDADELTVEEFTQGAHGTVTYNDDGTFTYTPDANYNGTDTFTYTITDGNDEYSTATVTINVEAVNDGPVAGDDTFETAEDSAVTTGNVLANDTDLDGDTLSVDSFTQGEHGTVSYNDDGTFIYTPDANYNGTDTFTYTVADGNGGTDTATITVNVTSVNDGPEAGADTYETAEDNLLTTGNVLANDTDLDGDTLSVDDFTQGEHGTVSYNGDGTFTYTPDANYNGTDTFTYTVADGNGGTDTATITVNVTAVNDGPEAAGETVSTLEDNATTIDVLANDTDLDGDSLSVDSVTQGANGTVTINDDGTVTYTPNANFNGTDTFTYTVTDSNGGTDTATVTVNVESVNDGPEANDDSFATDEDSAFMTDNVLANDTDIDGDTLAVSSFTQGENGTVVYYGNGSFRYIPNADFNGTDSFTYTVTDSNGGTSTATVTVDVGSVNDGPEANDDSFTTDEDSSVMTGNVLANDTDADGDDIAVTSFSQAENGTVVYYGNGSFKYTPNANFNGTDSFTYTVTDENGASSTATVYMNVESVNDGPVAETDSFTTDEDTAVVTGNVLTNDSDLDGDNIEVSDFTQAENGSVTYNDDGTFTYTPNANFNGTDTFTYTITDENGATDTTTVTVEVNSVNDEVIAGDDTVNTAEDTAITTGNLLANDTDADGDNLEVTDYSQAENGSVTYNGDGTFTYTPNANFNGTDTFTYTVTDENGSIDTATVTVNVESVNDGPVAGDDQITIAEDSSATINALDNDIDLDGDELTVQAFTQGEHGTVDYNGDGTFTYTPDANFNGTDTFAYTIIDENGATDTATITINVESVNDGPEAENDTLTISEDSTGTVDVLANDSDLDGDTLMVDNYTQAEHGTVSYNGDGTFTYTPDANYNGTDSFTYTVSDESGTIDTATVRINVASVNDGPIAGDDTIDTVEDAESASVNVLDNDFDIDGDEVQVSDFTQGANGTVTYNGDGSFQYVPNANFNGTDSFTYTITDSDGATTTATVNVNVQSVNDGPEASDDTITTSEDTGITTGNLMANDSDIDGDNIEVSEFTQGENGTVVYYGNGSFRYIPNADFNGTDSFTYTIVDENGSTSTATVNVEVESVNDGPVAADDSATTYEDVMMRTENVLENDFDLDGDTITVESFTQPEHGRVAYNNDGTFSYRPDSNYNGTDTFTYTVSDGNGGTDTATVSVNVRSLNDAPTTGADSVDAVEDTAIVTENVLANDFDVDGDDIAMTNFSQPSHGSVDYNGDGTFTYTPDANYNGPDSFTYTVTDENGRSTTQTVDIDVEAVNDNPEAANDMAETEYGESVDISVLANDSDIDGDTLSVQSFTQPGNGTVMLNGDGTFTYTPDEGHSGTDSFTYTVTDANGGTSTATVTINVAAQEVQPEETVEDTAPDVEDTEIENNQEAPQEMIQPTMAAAAEVQAPQEQSGPAEIEESEFDYDMSQLDSGEAPTISAENIEPELSAVYEQVQELNDLVDSAENAEVDDQAMPAPAFDSVFEEIDSPELELADDANLDGQQADDGANIAEEPESESFIAGLWSLIRGAAGATDDNEKKTNK